MHILYFLNTSSCSVFTSGIDFISAFCFYYLLDLDPQSAYWIVSHNTDPDPKHWGPYRYIESPLEM